MSTTYLIASCTERKRQPIPERTRLGSLPDELPALRATKWWERLTAEHGRHPALELYAGEHWTLARRSLEVLTVSGIEAALWAASAGFGLIPTSARICPYSATFSQGVADSVVLGRLRGDLRRARHQAWWSGLARFPGPDGSACRSLRALAVWSPHSALIVIGSADYVWAMREDLLSAREALRAPDRLILISNRVLSGDAELSRNLIPVDVRCRTVLGGTMQGLNARVALSLVERGNDGPLTVSRLRRIHDEMIRDVDNPPRPDREKTADEDVLGFLRAELARASPAGWTRLLRTLRGRGLACEQGRFKALYRRVLEQDDPSRGQARG